MYSMVHHSKRRNSKGWEGRKRRRLGGGGGADNCATKVFVMKTGASRSGGRKVRPGFNLRRVGGAEGGAEGGAGGV